MLLFSSFLIQSQIHCVSIFSIYGRMPAGDGQDPILGGCVTWLSLECRKTRKPGVPGTRPQACFLPLALWPSHSSPDNLKPFCHSIVLLMLDFFFVLFQTHF